MLDVARIEAGIPVYGRDMTEETLPIEANLEAAISYTKGCYIGQEVIARIEARGHVNRKLVGLLLRGEVLPEPGAKIVRRSAKLAGSPVRPSHLPGSRILRSAMYVVKS